MKKIVILLAACFYTLTGCNSVKTGADTELCPGGECRIQVYVEKFQSQAGLSIPENSEAQFNTRIQTLSYYLYRDGSLYQSGEIPGVASITAQTYLFSRADMLPGRYELVLLGNTHDNMPQMRDAGSAELTYPGYDRTADYFMDRFEFTVSDAENHEYITQLKRVHGFVRFNFLNLPADATSVEVQLDELTSHSYINGTYDGDYLFTRLLPATELQSTATNTFTSSVMTFPTMAGQQTSWRVRLYRDGETTPYYDNLIRNDLQVVRNQLLDLTMDFGTGDGTGDFTFSVGLDSEWDSWHELVGAVLQ